MTKPAGGDVERHSVRQRCTSGLDRLGPGRYAHVLATIVVAVFGVIAAAVPLVARVPAVLVADVVAALPASAVILSTVMIWRCPIRALVRRPCPVPVVPLVV